MTLIGGSAPSYDANGNVLNDFLHSYAWDAYGRPITIDGVSVTYDALGRMVEQNRSGVYSEITYAPDGTKIEIMSGQSFTKAFVPLPGGATAVYGGGIVSFRHPDHLGSSRFASTSTRTMYYDGAYAPFGEPYAQTGTTDLSFTGKNQDTVSNLYDFPAREYGIQGRWASPDPAGLAAVNPGNPQSLNRYSYVLNNPMAFTDPLGLVCSAAVANGDTGCNEANFGGGGGSGGYGFWGFGWLDVVNPGYGVETAQGGLGDGNVALDGYFQGSTITTYVFLSGGDDSSFSSFWSGLGKKIKAAVCKYTPTGRSTSVSLAAGGIGSVSGSGDMVVNYNSGQTSLFATGGGGLGWNGGASLTATTGLVYGLDGTNNGFKGVFKGGNLYVPTPYPGVSAGGSITNGAGVTVVSAGAGGALAGKYGFGGSWTNTTSPLNVGKFTGYSPIDYAGYLLRRPCN